MRPSLIPRWGGSGGPGGERLPQQFDRRVTSSRRIDMNARHGTSFQANRTQSAPLSAWKLLVVRKDGRVEGALQENTQ
jgi:hypothetical protein